MKTFIAICAIVLCQHLNSNAQTLKFENGKWFDGTGFKKADWYAVDGTLTKNPPRKIDSVINLNGGFVVPPFGEAHNHNVRKFSGFKDLSNHYLRDGIFYVKNPNCLTNTKESLTKAKLVNQKATIDAVFANGGLTSKGGHPIDVVKIMKMRGEWTDEEGDGNFYYSINSAEELTKKWAIIIGSHPDFIKTYLLFSEEFKKRDGNPKYEGYTGLNPALLKGVVDKAHAMGLRVSCHIETSYDLHVALLANVDEVNHMPGFRGDPMLNTKARADSYEKFIISIEDAQLAARQNITIVTTLSDVLEVPFIIGMRRYIENVNKKNLTTLKQAHVKIALGSDSFDHNSIAEVEYLKDKDIFSNLDLLKMLCETTPLTIFPVRKIGFLKEGYEASFLVLKEDPLARIDAIKNIKMGVKQGKLLNKQLQ